MAHLRGFIIGIAVLWSTAKILAIGEDPVDPARVNKEREAVKKEFAAAYKERDLSKRRELAWRMAIDARKDQAREKKVALLEEAAEIAAETGDVDLAWHALEVSAAIPGSNLGDLFDRRLKVTDEAARSERDGHEAWYQRRIGKAYLSLCDQALSSDKYDIAKNCARKAKKIAPGPLHLQWLASQREEECRTVSAEAENLKPMKRKLLESTEDPRAHQAIGSFLCFMKGDWKEGLPHLAKGSDEKLKKIAGKDAAAPERWQDQKEVGDAWWDYLSAISESETSGKGKLSRRRIEERAVLYYGKVLENIDGPEDKNEIEKRWVRLSRKKYGSILGDAVLRLPFDVVDIKLGSKRVTDLSGMENHATIFGGEVSPEGVHGSAVHLRGGEKHDKIEGNGRGKSFPLGSSPRTYAVWIQTTDKQFGSGNLLAYGGPGDGECFGVGLLGGAAPTIFGGGKKPNGQGNNHTGGGTSVNDGRWHYVVGVFEGPATNMCKVYVDGKLSVTDETVLVKTVEGKWIIGEYAGSLKGTVDEAIFLDEALTAEEVMLLFRFGRQGFGVDLSPIDIIKAPIKDFQPPKKNPIKNFQPPSKK